jgi:peptidyl-prolyl cis-trans isomerase B (cyclophilin B)
VKRAAFLAGLFALAPVLASAEDLELTASVDKAKVEVGERFTVTVRLTNKGEKPVELPKLALDRQLVSLEIQFNDGRKSFYERITPSPYQMKSDWERAELKPGDPWQLQVDLWALAEGKLTVTAHYGRWGEEYAKLYAEADEKVKANPDNAAFKAKLTSIEKMRGVGQVPHVVAEPIVVPHTKASSGEGQVSVRLLTSMGLIRLRLFPEAAPATSQHFAHFIRVGGEVKDKQRAPYYRDLTFHRVIQDFMIQGGCPQGNGLGGPGYAVPAEFASAEPEVDEALRHVPGRLSMARSGHDDSAGSQFFICAGVSADLDGKYTVFGEVTRGLEVVMTISEVATGSRDKPLEDVKIQLVELLPHADG